MVTITHISCTVVRLNKLSIICNIKNTIKGKINGCLADFKISINIVFEYGFAKLNFTNLMKCNRNLHAYGSKNYLSVSGYFEANFKLLERTLSNAVIDGNLMSIDLATKSSVSTFLNEIKKYYTRKVFLMVLVKLKL